MLPLQERANELGQLFQKEEESKKMNEKHILESNKRELVDQFTKDFPELYGLLIKSQIDIDADITFNGHKIILSHHGKQLSIYNEVAANLNKWSFHGKQYVPAANKQDELMLIIRIADAL